MKMQGYGTMEEHADMLMCAHDHACAMAESLHSMLDGPDGLRWINGDDAKLEEKLLRGDTLLARVFCEGTKEGDGKLRIAIVIRHENEDDLVLRVEALSASKGRPS